MKIKKKEIEAHELKTVEQYRYGKDYWGDSKEPISHHTEKRKISFKSYYGEYQTNISTHFKKKYGNGILEIGCAFGQLSSKLNAVGIDISRYAIEEGKRKRTFDGIVSDATHLPFKDESFDIVLSFDVIEHLEYPEVMIEEIYRVLRFNGVVIVNTPNENSPIRKLHEIRYFLKYRRKDVNITHISLMSGFQLKKLLEENNFEIGGYYSPYFYEISKIILGKSSITSRKHNLLLSPIIMLVGLKHEK